MGTENQKLVIRNIGLILSGKIEQPMLDGGLRSCDRGQD